MCSHPKPPLCSACPLQRDCPLPLQSCHLRGWHWGLQMLPPGGIVLSTALGRAGSTFCAVLDTSTQNRRAYVERDTEHGLGCAPHCAPKAFTGLVRGRSCPVQPKQTLLLEVMGSCSSWWPQGTQGTGPQHGWLVGRKEVPRDESSLPFSSAFLWSWWGRSQMRLVSVWQILWYC